MPPVKKNADGLDPLTLVGVLPPIDGGEENLLRKDAWLQPLRAEFALWSNPAPAPQLTDRVELIWDNDEDNPVHTKLFKGPLTDDDLPGLWLEVPVDKLTEGVHSIYYRVFSWNASAVPRASEPVNVTIDKTPPILAGDRRLVFPATVLPPNKITAQYLDDPANADQVVATLPDYIGKKVGDVISWFWEEFPHSDRPVDSLTLDSSSVGQPIRIAFKGDMLRALKNGLWYATCRVSDRAGQEVTSLHVLLELNILPPPLRLPPRVKEASGSLLDPTFYGVAGVTVVIPRQDDEGEGRKREVFWRGYGPMGFHHALQPTPANPSEFAIPAAAIPSNMAAGRVVEITYRVEGDAKESDPLKLRVSTIAANKFPQIDCPQAARGNPLLLSRGAVSAQGAELTLERWVYQVAGQLINIWLTSASLPDEWVREAAPVALGTHRARIPKALLDRLPLNALLAVHVSVSFDGGDSYVPFSRRDIRILA